MEELVSNGRPDGGHDPVTFLNYGLLYYPGPLGAGLCLWPIRLLSRAVEIECDNAIFYTCIREAEILHLL